MVNRQTIRGKIFHLVLIGVLLFSLGAVAILPQPVSASPGEWALSFDGMDDYVDVPDHLSLNPEHITIEAWVKAESITDPGMNQIVSKEASGSGYGLRLRNGKFEFYAHIAGGWGLVFPTTPTPVVDTWHHLVATFDGTVMRLFEGGIEIGTLSVSGTIASSPNAVQVGRDVVSRARHFNGIIDEVRIYNRAITAEEISYSYNGGKGRYTPYDQTGLVGWWHFDEGTGNIINDETLNDNDGTIYGATFVAGFLFTAPIAQIEFTTPEQTLLVNKASAAMTIQTQDEFGGSVSVDAETVIALTSTSVGDEFSLSPSLDPWVPISSVTIPAGQSEATFYYKDSIIGTPTITAAEFPDAGWIDATQVVTVQGPVELWRGEELIGTYLTIQEAIDAAEDGDRIIVLPGTYEEQIDIYKQVTVKSGQGAATTIIDAQEGTALAWEFGPGMAVYPAVLIQRDGVVFGNAVQGFTIRNTVPMVFPEGEEDPSDFGVAILATASGVTIRGNTIEDSNPIGIFAFGDANIISQNIVSASIIGIYAFGEEGSTITGNIVSSTMMGGIYSGGQGGNISDNNLYDNQGTAVISLEHVSNATVSGNTISRDKTSIAGGYGIEVKGGHNNTISGNIISHVVLGGISLNDTSENSLSLNTISDITGYTLSDEHGGMAEWTREQARFERYSVKLEIGDDPLGAARLEMPMAFPFQYFEMGGELYFWAYLLDTALLPTYQLALDTDDNGIADVTLSVNTGRQEGLWPNEWLKLYAMGWWTDVATGEPKSLSDWIIQYSDAKVVKFSVVYAGAANKTMYIDGSKEEDMPIEPPKGIVISRSNRNSVSDSFIIGINGAGILIVESHWNMLGDNNTISYNKYGIFIENSNENTVSGSTISNNAKEGILIRQSYNNQIIRNDITGNTGGMSGIHLDGESAGIEIHANNIVGNTPFGVFKDGGWVNATGNWWGDASGPYHEWQNPGGTGDAVSDFVHFEPWITTVLPEFIAPTIVGNLAMPRMTAVLGMFMGDVGPEWTSLVVEAYDNPGGVGIAQVTVDLKQLLLQMLPGVVIPPEKQGEWDRWLSKLERSPLGHRGNDVYKRHFNLWEFMHRLRWYLGEDDTQRIMDKLTLGDFSIPVTVTDWGGNWVSGNIALTIVDVIQPLKKGWNLVSTPVTLDDYYATWVNLVTLGDGLLWDDAIRYDSALGVWVDVVDPLAPTYELKPLEPIYIHATGNDQIGIIFNRGVTLPPMLDLWWGWNLVGLAIPPTDWDLMPVNEAMVTVEDASGVRGYSIVVSPDQRVDYHEEYRYQDYGFGGYGWHFEQNPWVYTLGSDDIKEMSVGGGYWVFMEEYDTLAGFSTTPVTIVHAPEPGHDLDPLVPRYNWERVTRTLYEEYHPSEGYTEIYLTYSGDVSPSRVFRFYKERMPELGWVLTAEESSADRASLDFTLVMGSATFSCQIDVVGGESIKILFELWEPGVDLPDVPRYDWDPVVMTAYAQTMGATGTHTNISYEGELDPEWVYKFYQGSMGAHPYYWEHIGDERHHEFAWLMFERTGREDRTYICLIWVEKGLIEIEHHQFAASVSEEYIDGVISLWRQKIKMRIQEMW